MFCTFDLIFIHNNYKTLTKQFPNNPNKFEIEIYYYKINILIVDVKRLKAPKILKCCRCKK